MAGQQRLLRGGIGPPRGSRPDRRHADRQAETFAIDWARLRDGEAFSGDGDEDWYGFGAEVLAVADGVVAIQEGYPEEVPLQPVTHVTRPEDYGGNAISLEIAPGSTPTTRTGAGQRHGEGGDRVTTGQVLGCSATPATRAAPSALRVDRRPRPPGR